MILDAASVWADLARFVDKALHRELELAVGEAIPRWLKEFTAQHDWPWRPRRAHPTIVDYGLADLRRQAKPGRRVVQVASARRVVPFFKARDTQSATWAAIEGRERTFLNFNGYSLGANLAQAACELAYWLDQARPDLLSFTSPLLHVFQEAGDVHLFWWCEALLRAPERRAEDLSSVVCARS